LKIKKGIEGSTIGDSLFTVVQALLLVQAFIPLFIILATLGLY